MNKQLSRLFVCILPEYKDDFLKETGRENINRLPTLGIAISALEGHHFVPVVSYEFQV